MNVNWNHLKHDETCFKKVGDNLESLGAHSMSVTGMRCHKGKLQYLVQNSWGGNICGLYSLRPPKIVCDDKNKEEGSFWMPDEFFVKGESISVLD